MIISTSYFYSIHISIPVIKWSMKQNIKSTVRQWCIAGELCEVIKAIYLFYSEALFIVVVTERPNGHELKEWGLGSISK